MTSSQDLPVRGERRFLTTRWSMVADAARGESESSRVALEELCTAYWFPLYAFARRNGAKPEEAADLTQSFFLQLLDKGTLDAADPERGRFRTFLLTAFQNHCRNTHRAEQTIKRGGQARVLSIDVELSESRYRAEPTDEVTADRIFEREWALALLDRVFERLQAEFDASGRGELFAVVRGRLTGATEPGYREVAEQFGMTDTAVKVVVHRLRGRYRELLRDEVLQTVRDADDVDDELKRLFQTFQ